MTSSNGLKSVVSDYGECVRLAPRKPLNLKQSVLRDTSALMWGSLRGALATTLFIGGGRRDPKRISAFQPNKIQSGSQDCYRKDGKALKIQHQLSHHLDSEVSPKTPCREGRACSKVNHRGSMCRLRRGSLGVGSNARPHSSICGSNAEPYALSDCQAVEGQHKHTASQGLSSVEVSRLSEGLEDVSLSLGDWLLLRFCGSRFSGCSKEVYHGTAG